MRDQEQATPGRPCDQACQHHRTAAQVIRQRTQDKQRRQQGEDVHGEQQGERGHREPELGLIDAVERRRRRVGGECQDRNAGRRPKRRAFGQHWFP